jgi:hypothetical protein
VAALSNNVDVLLYPALRQLTSVNGIFSEQVSQALEAAQQGLRIVKLELEVLMSKGDFSAVEKGSNVPTCSARELIYTLILNSKAAKELWNNNGQDLKGFLGNKGEST